MKQASVRKSAWACVSLNVNALIDAVVNEGVEPDNSLPLCGIHLGDSPFRAQLCQDRPSPDHLNSQVHCLVELVHAASLSGKATSRARSHAAVVKGSKRIEAATL